MKGILLAGGMGTRLHPLTKKCSKHLLPVYDKPMIYYSLSVLMLANIREIMLITTPEHLSAYQTLLRDGKHLGISIEYAVQTTPRGIADAFFVAHNFVKNHKTCLILGDNFFWGKEFQFHLEKARKISKGATLFAYKVKEPQHFGVVSFNENNKILSLEEKPQKPRSNFAVTGLYFYDEMVLEALKNIRPSLRGELEITAINKWYFKQNSLSVKKLENDSIWADMGTPQKIAETSQFVEKTQKKNNCMVACLEEIALSKAWVSQKDLEVYISKKPPSKYNSYVKNLLK